MAFDYRNLLWEDRRQAKRMWSHLAALEAIAAGKQVTVACPTEEDAAAFIADLRRLMDRMEGKDAAP